MISKKFALGCGVLALAVASGAAQAQQKGPDPTLAGIQQAGPFAISQQTLRGNGFGGATVYSPNTAGTYALIVVCPGFTARQRTIRVVSQRLASHGFVVATIDTNSTFDFPESRGTQLAAAMRSALAINTGPAAGKIDRAAGRQGFSGHSMGGGGTLIALRNDRTKKAGMTFTPFAQSSNFSALVGQTNVTVGGQNDTIAPNNQHSIPFAASTAPDNPTLLCIINGEDHFFVQDATPRQPASLYQIATFKRYLDNDARYTQFLVQQPGCGAGTFRRANIN